MVAWRDPNVIPIRAFYGEDLKVNFCGKLAADPQVEVRGQARPHRLLLLGGLHSSFTAWRTVLYLFDLNDASGV